MSVERQDEGSLLLDQSHVLTLERADDRLLLLVGRARRHEAEEPLSADHDDDPEHH